MKAYRLETPGSPAQLVDVDRPHCPAGMVRVKIRACGLNFADLLMQNGTYQETPPAPFTLGMEIAGEIDVAEDSQCGFRPGDRVAVYSGHGGLAEYGIFDPKQCIAIPAQMDFVTAAAFQIAYATSHMALAHRAQLQPAERLLVLGAAGGVGLTAVEIGKLMGAEVIACARGTKKLEVAASAGADHLLDTDDPELREKIKSLGGADVVYDAVGGAAWRAAFRACNPEARLIVIGFASGDIPQIPANHLMVKNLTAIGFYIGGYRHFRPQVVTDSYRQLLAWFAAGKLAPHISHQLPLARVEEGKGLLRARKSTGKVVITI